MFQPNHALNISFDQQRREQVRQDQVIQRNVDLVLNIHPDNTYRHRNDIGTRVEAPQRPPGHYRLVQSGCR